jgi:hypothetical protein
MATLRVRDMHHQTYRKLQEVAEVTGANPSTVARTVLDAWAKKPEDHFAREALRVLHSRAQFLARTDPKASR